uniref:SFRICE_014234 n=1 Tax=Spodoptera frugiperda TaxID=7108 RepID=A0A2H1WFG1_SPOFR
MLQRYSRISLADNSEITPPPAPVNDTGDADARTLQGILPARYILSVLGSIGFAIVYGLKVNLSVAMVGMLNHTALKKAQAGSGTPGAAGPEECTAPGGASNATEQDGPFTWSSEVQGIVLSCYFWGYLVSQLPAARIAELYSAKWVMFFSVFINVVCTLLTPVMCNLHYIGVVLMRIGEGIGGGVTFPAMHTMLSKWAPPSERSFMAALTYAGTSLGTVISMLMAGVLTVHFGWESVFYVMGGLSLIWCVLWVVMVQDTPQQQRFMNNAERTMILQALGNQENQGPKPKIPMPWGKVFKSPPFLAILVAHTCSNFGWYMVLIELPFYMKQVLKFNMTEMGGFKKKFRYCVIKLKKTRESGLDPYVCVPYSWLKLHKRALVVKYPKEITSMTSYMVKHCEVSQPDWLTIGAEIKYKTDSYVDAQMCLSKLLQGHREKYGQQDNTPTSTTQTKSSKAFEIPKELERFNVKIFGTEDNQKKEIQRSTNTEAGVSKEFKGFAPKPLLTNQFPPKPIDQKQNPVFDKKVNANKHAPKLIIKKKKPITNKLSRSKLMSEPEDSDSNNEAEDAGDAEDAEEAEECGPYDAKTTTIVNLWKTIQDQIAFIEQLEDSDKKFNGVEDKMTTAMKAVDTLKDLIDQLEALEDDDDDDDDDEDEDGEQEATKVESETRELKGKMIKEEEEEIEEQKEEETEVTEGEDKEEETEKEELQDGNPRTVNLPPEYDRNDSRWTLKYKNYAPELTELVDNSRVYVNSKNLAAVVNKSQNPKQLARNLLEEVFSKNALYVCKLPQPTIVVSDTPELDSGAINAILDFVQKHTTRVNWQHVKRKIVKLSLRGKLSYAHKKFKQNALAVSMPFLSLWFFSMTLSRTLDWLREKKYITTSTARKIATGFASLVPAVCLLAICYIGCNRSAAVIIMATAVTSIGGMFCGFLSNHIDIAPNFAGTLMAMTNTVATIPGIVVPIFVGYITHGDQTITAWRKIFFTTIGLYAVELVTYTVFGSGEEQPWNKVETGAQETETKPLRK